MVAQHCECTKCRWIVHFKVVNFTLRELYLKKKKPLPPLGRWIPKPGFGDIFRNQEGGFCFCLSHMPGQQMNWPSFGVWPQVTRVRRHPMRVTCPQQPWGQPSLLSPHSAINTSRSVSPPCDHAPWDQKCTLSFFPWHRGWYFQALNSCL